MDRRRRPSRHDEVAPGIPPARHARVAAGRRGAAGQRPDDLERCRPADTSLSAARSPTLAGNTVNAERDLTVRPSAHGPQDKPGSAYGQPVATTPKSAGTAQTASEVSRDLFSGAAANSSGGKARPGLFRGERQWAADCTQGTGRTCLRHADASAADRTAGSAAPSTSPAAPPQQPSTLPTSPARRGTAA